MQPTIYIVEYIWESSWALSDIARHVTSQNFLIYTTQKLKRWYRFENFETRDLTRKSLSECSTTGSGQVRSELLTQWRKQNKLRDDVVTQQIGRRTVVSPYRVVL